MRSRVAPALTPMRFWCIARGTCLRRRGLLVAGAHEETNNSPSFSKVLLRFSCFYVPCCLGSPWQMPFWEIRSPQIPDLGEYVFFVPFPNRPQVQTAWKWSKPPSCFIIVLRHDAAWRWSSQAKKRSGDHQDHPMWIKGESKSRVLLCFS